MSVVVVVTMKDVHALPKVLRNIRRPEHVRMPQSGQEVVLVDQCNCPIDVYAYVSSVDKEERTYDVRVVV